MTSGRSRDIQPNNFLFGLLFLTLDFPAHIVASANYLDVVTTPRFNFLKFTPWKTGFDFKNAP